MNKKANKIGIMILFLSIILTGCIKPFPTESKLYLNNLVYDKIWQKYQVPKEDIRIYNYKNIIPNEGTSDYSMFFTIEYKNRYPKLEMNNVFKESEVISKSILIDDIKINSSIKENISSLLYKELFKDLYQKKLTTFKSNSVKKVENVYITLAGSITEDTQDILMRKYLNNEFQNYTTIEFSDFSKEYVLNDKSSVSWKVLLNYEEVITDVTESQLKNALEEIVSQCDLPDNYYFVSFATEYAYNTKEQKVTKSQRPQYNIRISFNIINGEIVYDQIIKI